MNKVGLEILGCDGKASCNFRSWLRFGLGFSGDCLEAGGTWLFVYTLLSFSSVTQTRWVWVSGKDETEHILAVSAAGHTAI